jgi:molybdenum-dependent DNA-binding transcriptional regulator ModE
LNVAFVEPRVAKQTGGSGGAMLTRLGREVVQRCRRIERRTASAGRPDLEALTAALTVAQIPSPRPSRREG